MVDADKLNYDRMNALKADVEQWGEVHATVAEIDAEVEMRKGQTSFDTTADLVVVDDGTTEHFFAMDDIVHWYCPYDVFHE